MTASRPNNSTTMLTLACWTNWQPLTVGHSADQVWNPHAVMELSKLLTERGHEQVVFLADCALISTDSLLNLAGQKVQFISRFPETFRLAEELKAEAWRKGEWEDLGQLAAKESEKASCYQSWKAVREVGGEKFGFVVVHSSNLAERKTKTLAAKVERRKKEFVRKGAELKKQPFACEADAVRAGEKLRKAAEAQGFESEYSVMKMEQAIYGHRGRPKKDEVPELRVSWYVEPSIGEMREAVLEEKKRLASTFVLIYRLADELSATEILRSYKNQDRVEQGFRFLKQPQNLGPVYTKKPERIESLGYIFLMVLLLAKYLEYRVHVSLAQSGETLKVGGQKVKRPTAQTRADASRRAQSLQSLN